MSRTLSPIRSSRGALVAALTVAVLFAGWMVAPDSYSQAPSPSTPNASLNALLTKLKAQQDQITANQTKIETQTAALKEELHQARLYSARGGAGRR